MEFYSFDEILWNSTKSAVRRIHMEQWGPDSPAVQTPAWEPGVPVRFPVRAWWPPSGASPLTKKIIRILIESGWILPVFWHVFLMCFEHVLDGFWTCLGDFRTCLEHVWGNFWTCSRHVSGMFWTCSGHVWDMIGICFGYVLDTFWTSSGHLLDKF